ncbi:hypothetical protein MOMA_02465 [Moraxella macacae 0408225]|uniref:Uncharacterized protein n=1 Tax=Moraxella macacae 0408225 TaxID=1230338 RepID=L2F865_9GAMM|nr:hypothetical protein [Moraxella macacae]ELA09232.1 hypothetical protein MOMA_02465 [Moraxella macacae 0408225]
MTDTINPLLSKNPYFNHSGLTSSQANYVCERIKEHLKPIQDQVQNLETHTSSLDGEKLDNFERVDNIQDKLTKIGQMYAISAFLRTAIKEKDERINKINIKINQLHINIINRLHADHQEQLDKLTEKQTVTIDDFLLTLPLNDVVIYKTAEAKAAHIGKFIHNFDNIRQLINKKERIGFKQVGEQVFKIHHTPLYTLDELQALQAFLLAKHRECENTVNRYKAQFHEFENEHKRQYLQQFNRINDEHTALINQLVAQETEELLAVKSQIADFKIIIPNEFKVLIYDLLKETS